MSGDAAAVGASIREPERFEAIFDSHHDVIWTYLARLGGAEHADELTAEVFLIAFARRATYDPVRGTVRSWLYGIALNLSRRRWRSDRRRTQAFARASAQRNVVSCLADDIADAITVRRELSRAMDALARVRPTDRDLIVLSVWENLSYEEIATVLDVEIGTVKSRLSRARTRLRELSRSNDELFESNQPTAQPVQESDHG